MSKLKGKVALVTGASKGIGAAIAKSLAAEGAAVVVNYGIPAKRARMLSSRISSPPGARLPPFAAMFPRLATRRPSSTPRSVKFGRLDILVNNSGVYGFSPLESITEEDFHRHFNVNVLGLLLTTQACRRRTWAKARASSTSGPL